MRFSAVFTLFAASLVAAAPANNVRQLDAVTGLLGGATGGGNPVSGATDAVTGLLGGATGGGNPVSGATDAVTGLLGGATGGSGGGDLLSGIIDAILGPNGLLGGLLGGKFKQDMSKEEMGALKEIEQTFMQLRDDLKAKGL